MRSNIQDALLSALESILRPTVKLLLQCGIGYSEFAAVAKSVFIQVATDDYKRRGRPANFSQVSAMTGISRKEVSRIRNAETDVRWTPNMETSPVNTVLHQWHFDEDFSDGAGTPKPLLFEGPLSFSTLVARYISDIPPGAMRSILEKAQVVTQDGEGRLLVSKAFANSTTFNSMRTSSEGWRSHGATSVQHWSTTPRCINGPICPTTKRTISTDSRLASGLNM
jgi:hypothetical protein